ncbi:MAG: dodecin domain-containing protein [Balneolaceae bacterium]|jgi:dodecin|nr:dodecin domain-containing protein [Balneolaceae bacterium]
MSDNSVYKIIELVGTSSESWEKAAENAVKKASQSLSDLRIAEVKSFDVKLNNDKIEAYRVRMNVSFKYKKE